MRTKAVRLYGKEDLRLEEFDLPEIREDEILVRDDGSWSFDGMVDIEEFKETIGVRELPDEDRVGYRTLAGFVLSQMGEIPSVGTSFDWENFHFEIVDMDGLRIDRIFVNRLDPEKAETEDPKDKTAS